MSVPEQTYELKLLPDSNQTKEALVSWLLAQGQDSFVEETCDGLYLDDPEDKEQFSWDEYLEKTGKRSFGLSLYSYDLEDLKKIEESVLDYFSLSLKTQILVTRTSDWLDGWKEHFKPILTSKFGIYPPWIDVPPEKEEEKNESRHYVVIEPGMAFGTGQHETTALCLEALSSLSHPCEKVLDVGTGTGILAIAAKKWGAREIHVCDIDADSILAAKENGRLNHVQYECMWKGSLPHPQEHQSFDLVFGNILAPVLLNLMKEFAKVTKPKGVVILSGLLTEQAQSIIDCAQSYGLLYEKRFQEKDWESLMFVKK